MADLSSPLTLRHEYCRNSLASPASLAITVGVPNSLGPGELLQHYGTEEQKNHYLPRLARGLEIPCFALTSPEAGSDAGAIPDTGVVCMGDWQGQQVLGMRLTSEQTLYHAGAYRHRAGAGFQTL